LLSNSSLAVSNGDDELQKLEASVAAVTDYRSLAALLRREVIMRVGSVCAVLLCTARAPAVIDCASWLCPKKREMDALVTPHDLERLA
jgi:hypothetical protein